MFAMTHAAWVCACSYFSSPEVALNFGGLLLSAWRLTLHGSLNLCFRFFGCIQLLVVIAGIQRWKALMTREFTLIKRTIIMYKAKSFQIFVLGICAATLFLRTHVRPVSPNDGQQIAGFTFFGLLVIMVNGIAEMAMAVSTSGQRSCVIPSVLGRSMSDSDDHEAGSVYKGYPTNLAVQVTQA